MDPIYVTGHRNPDTDSIVAAMAYAALRNAVGDREYKAACLGRVSDETQLVLDRFGFEPPKRITSMYTQVQDLDFDTPPVLDANVTVAQAWKTFQAQPSIPALPVANEDGTLYGMLSKDYIATYNMDLIAGAELADVPLFNVLSVLEGKVLNDAGDQVDTISGKVTIALPQNRESLLWSRKDSIVFCGTQPDMIRRALEMNVTAVVLCQAELDEELRNYPTTTCIISTPYAAYRATRMIFQSTPIGRICRKNDLVCFHLEDRVDDVKEAVLKHRESCYPILDGDEKIGVLVDLTGHDGLLLVAAGHAPGNGDGSWWTTTRRPSPSPAWRRRRSWRSSTTTAWQTSRPPTPSMCAMSPWALPIPSSPECTRTGGSCPLRAWPA